MALDLRPKWLNVTRSLQKAACRNNGIAVVSSQIVVNDSGDPITWTEPDIVRLGPLSAQDDLVRLLGSLSSRAYYTEYLIAQVIDSRTIAINRGKNDGVINEDWFVCIDNNRPYAILAVSELRERIAILTTIWVSREVKSTPIAIGDPLHRLHW